MVGVDDIHGGSWKKKHLMKKLSKRIFDCGISTFFSLVSLWACSDPIGVNVSPTVLFWDSKNFSILILCLIGILVFFFLSVLVCINNVVCLYSSSKSLCYTVLYKFVLRRFGKQYCFHSWIIWHSKGRGLQEKRDEIKRMSHTTYKGGGPICV